MPARPPTPVVVLEAGGEPWARVAPLLDRRAADITGQGLIEIVTADAGVCSALLEWCAQRRAVIERRADVSGSTTFRIRLKQPLQEMM